MAYRIKNWKKFQHFKDRRPPWVKLYRDILDDADFFDLSDGDAKTLILLWLIAGDDDMQKGYLPCAKKLAFRLRKKESDVNQSLTRLSHWLIQDDINVISEGYQLGSPERETETYKPETETYKPETDRENDIGAIAPQATGKPVCPTRAIIDLYHQKLPELPRVARIHSARDRSIKAIWNELVTGKEALSTTDALAEIGVLFDQVRGSSFLLGKTSGKDGKPFKCTIDFIFNQANITKIVEGKYHD